MLKGLHCGHVAEIQEATTDELKKVQKEEFLAAFQKLYNCAKACIYASGAYFEYKKRYASLIFKKISPKTYGLHCVKQTELCIEYYKFINIKMYRKCLKVIKYEGRLISNAHSEISRKRDYVFKQVKVGSKVQYFSYKLTYLFFDIVALSFNTFFPT